MNLGFSADQEAIREEFRKALSNSAPRAALLGDSRSTFDQALWARLAELGWLGTAIREEHGGSGLDPIVLCVLAEEIGRHMAAVPFSASVCGFAFGLAAAGDADLTASVLPRIVDGTAVGVLLTSDCWQEAPRLQQAFPGQALLSGAALNVLDGAAATVALACIGSGTDSRLVHIDLSQLAKHGLADPRLDLLHPSASVNFESTAVQVLAAGAAASQRWEHILNSYALFVAFEQLGGAEAALEMARQYSLNRYAFGRPIGSFQAVKHTLADMLVSVDLARSNCYFGAAVLSMGPEPLAEAAAVARISATDAFRQCARGNIQIHGALGVTWESDCHLYYRRAQALASSPGAPRFWKERLIELLTHRRTGNSAAAYLQSA